MIDLKDKIILITGGTGSFGHALVKRIIDHAYKEIRIFSRDELKQEIMRNDLNNSKVKFYLGDVRDRDSVELVMKNVDIVFHAAALKQVPSCEFFPIQAVLTNILGSNNVINSAIKNRVKNIVCLSTDKAVYPISAMGMTKALMEKTAQSFSRNLGNNDTIVSSVRYGNVMCTRGSVIPLFIKQIKENKPITITNPDMTRFLLSLEEAIDLVLFAFENANQGDIFIRKAPACTISVLATAVKNVFSSETPTQVIGMRHGEKIFEALASMEELRKAEEMEDYYRVRMDDRDLNYNKYYIEGDLKESLLEDYTSHNTRRLKVKEVEKSLLLLPEITCELNAKS